MAAEAINASKAKGIFDTDAASGKFNENAFTRVGGKPRRRSYFPDWSPLTGVFIMSCPVGLYDFFSGLMP
jgi:hypothetical protein